MTESQLTTAYAVCRGIARREARNFYYSFLALPLSKRNALSAVYAFMRHADDISDDENLSFAERQRRLREWLDRWHEAQESGSTDDPVFLALADAQKRYQISAALLDQLVEGTSMDLVRTQEESKANVNRLDQAEHGGTAVAAQAVRVHQTFADLYRYCYLVASVVGLVCIRIYGYEDRRAEELAEKCGVAFQLTNMIRDVKEDASMGRVYFPEEDLARFGLTVDDFLQDSGARLEQSRVGPLLEFQARRAGEYYQAATELIPLVHEDSRPALWVMVTIYQRLLEKMVASNFDVLHARVRLGAAEKLGILGRGIIKSVFRTI